MELLGQKYSFYINSCFQMPSLKVHNNLHFHQQYMSAPFQRRVLILFNFYQSENFKVFNFIWLLSSLSTLSDVSTFSDVCRPFEFAYLHTLPIFYSIVDLFFFFLSIFNNPISIMLLFGRSVISKSLWPCRLQHTRLPCPSLYPGCCCCY